MPKKKLEPKDKEVELKSNEEYLCSDNIELEVAVGSEDPVVYVRFEGFEDHEEAEEYAEFLAETLPLLLFESTRLQ